MTFSVISSALNNILFFQLIFVKENKSEAVKTTVRSVDKDTSIETNKILIIPTADFADKYHKAKILAKKQVNLCLLLYY